MAKFNCVECGKEVNVVPARLATAKFCSVKCRAEWRKTNFKGELNPKWKGGPREKDCQHCGKTFQWTGKPLQSWNAQKFCSKACVVAGQTYIRGEQHHNYNPDARRKSRPGYEYVKWQAAVLLRDKMTCQKCGATGVELHAHHLKPWKDHPDLRFDVANGMAVCAPCHWSIHSAGNEKAVNSVEPPPASQEAEGNTEPSSDRKVIEGVTTRGRAYRRFVCNCEWCGTQVTRPAGKLKYSAHHFCSKVCAGKYSAAKRYGSNTSTSAAPEREDIV